uniref:Cytochrome P450 n=1 Tax=Quercus lobata TaxID=97700 RepID=A0A7N2ML34_QUELO
MDMRYPSKPKVIDAWAIGIDAACWHDAESFIPERSRMCPGVAFGLANIELPLTQLLYHFDWELPGRTRPEDLDMTEKFGSVVRRKKRSYLVAKSYTPWLNDQI